MIRFVSTLAGIQYDGGSETPEGDTGKQRKIVKQDLFRGTAAVLAMDEEEVPEEIVIAHAHLLVRTIFLMDESGDGRRGGKELPHCHDDPCRSGPHDPEPAGGRTPHPEKAKPQLKKTQRGNQRVGTQPGQQEKRGAPGASQAANRR